MRSGYTNKYDSYKREIWVQRNNFLIEFKIWFIYSFNFIGRSKEKIVDFIRHERERFDWHAPLMPTKLKEASLFYRETATSNNFLPPRLWTISEEELMDFKTELYTDSNQFVFGDSVGGIAPNMPDIHNEHLKLELFKQKTVLFSPGVLARIIVNVDGVDYYVFQLAEKNLRKKGEVFYKPIGGHIKASSMKYDYLINEYKLLPKDQMQVQDVNDVAFYINTEYFKDFVELFNQDIFFKQEYFYFENPEISIIRELHEELGPIPSRDGISLLSNDDLKLNMND